MAAASSAGGRTFSSRMRRSSGEPQSRRRGWDGAGAAGAVPLSAATPMSGMLASPARARGWQASPILSYIL